MDLRYIELKTGYHDDGPAWIGKVKVSKTGKTVYFNNHAFQRYNGGVGNYIDVETGDIYWISGVKKNGNDRHWAGRGKIIIDRKVIEAYLLETDASSLDESRFEVKEIVDFFPVDRINGLLNGEEKYVKLEKCPGGRNFINP